MTPLMERVQREENEVAVLRSIVSQIAVLRKRAGKRLFLCVYKEGGIGDWMQQSAVAMAVRRKFPKSFIVAVGRDVGPDADGVPLVNNLLRHHPAIDHTICYPPTNWMHTIQAIYKRFDIFYQPHYVMRTYDWASRERQHQADLCLAPYLKYAIGFPLSNAQIEETGESQFQMLAASSGLDVSEADLWIEPTTKGLRGVMPAHPFVTMHNMAGGMAYIKCASMQTMHAIATGFTKAGIAPVQVGAKTDPPIPGTLDRRGYTINQTAAIIKRARLHIDIEGGLVYVAKAVCTQSAVFFGPTPVCTFAMPGNIVLTTFACHPCWWYADRWGVNCRDRKAVCMNFPQDGARVAEALLKRISPEKKLNRQDAKNAEKTKTRRRNA